MVIKLVYNVIVYYCYTIDTMLLIQYCNIIVIILIVLFHILAFGTLQCALI